MSTDPARRAAYDALHAVNENGAYANLLLPGLLRERDLVGRDAAFATELTYGALRAQGTLDAVIARCSSRDLSTVEPSVLDLLRLGAYQLLYLRVPAHAAVSTSVDLASRRTAGFVNAVLRGLAQHDRAQWIGILADGADSIDGLALEFAHPRWIVEAFRDALDGDGDRDGGAAELRQALAADNERPLVHLVARPGRIERADLRHATGGSEGPWSPYAVRLHGGDPAGITAVADGRAGVQDEGSQLVATALATVPIDGRDRRWLDLCSGPGGKTALLASLAPAGARVTAVEPRPHRARLVARACQGLPVDVVEADGMTPAWAEATFDRVLVDAPCTGLGALRRRPEARWRRRPDDVAELTALQLALLRSAMRSVRPGGVVGYAVCSPYLPETHGVVAAVVEQREATLIDARPLLPGVPDLGDGPTIQLWPHRHGTDAMFLALLRR
ncbi:MAG: RsmB/NOP family class I SAM-dependent RNA methyltransferase [Mycobacteriales bacterium]|nr:MAG: methyltransferase [Pseudonocardiales bacterium]